MVLVACETEKIVKYANESEKCTRAMAVRRFLFKGYPGWINADGSIGYLPGESASSAGKAGH